MGQSCLQFTLLSERISPWQHASDFLHVELVLFSSHLLLRRLRASRYCEEVAFCCPHNRRGFSHLTPSDQFSCKVHFPYSAPIPSLLSFGRTCRTSYYIYRFGSESVTGFWTSLRSD